MGQPLSYATHNVNSKTCMHIDLYLSIAFRDILYMVVNAKNCP